MGWVVRHSSAAAHRRHRWRISACVQAEVATNKCLSSLRSRSNGLALRANKQNANKSHTHATCIKLVSNIRIYIFVYIYANNRCDKLTNRCCWLMGIGQWTSCCSWPRVAVVLVPEICLCMVTRFCPVAQLGLARWGNTGRVCDAGRAASSLDCTSQLQVVVFVVLTRARARLI
jgi:hypothetical protein